MGLLFYGLTFKRVANRVTLCICRLSVDLIWLHGACALTGASNSGFIFLYFIDVVAWLCWPSGWFLWWLGQRLG